MALTGECRDIPSLSKAEVARMFELLDDHFEGVEADRFEGDLSEKHWVLVIRDDEGVIQGFSTAMLMDADVEGEAVRAIYSGDTIINRAYWGDKILGTLFLRFVIDVAKRCPDRRVFWFLISMGYKTYRLLKLFFHDYHPRWDVETPPWAKNVLDTLGRCKFGEHYDAARGVVSFSGKRERLRKGVADVTEAHLRHPEIRFFVERNPNHEDGDELACIAEIRPENFTRAAKRVLR